MISVHDNEIYAYVVSLRDKRIVLHTELPNTEEFTDIVFFNVVAFQFENANVGQNVLFDVVERSPLELFKNYHSLLRPKIVGGISHGYSYLPFEYASESEFVTKLDELGIKCYDVLASWGLSGFVIAETCDRIARSKRMA